jgi:TatD DNase family protein
MLIDTHTHLYDDETIALQDASIKRALEANVQQMFMPNCDYTTLAPMLAISERFPNQCYPMLGLHPCYVKEKYQEELKQLYNYIDQHKFAAIGEIGLDYYWDKTFIDEQKIAFETQINWALDAQLPIVIHSRASTSDCIDIVSKKQNGSLVAIFHCFSGTLEEAKKIVDLGGYLGIGGVVTYKKSELPELLQQIPLSNIVLETDAPYLAPVPFRGKRNESAHIVFVADKLGEVYNIHKDEVARITTENARKIFSTSFN